MVQYNKQITTPDELDVLGALGLPWIEPKDRNKEKTVEFAKLLTSKFSAQ